MSYSTSSRETPHAFIGPLRRRDYERGAVAAYSNGRYSSTISYDATVRIRFSGTHTTS